MENPPPVRFSPLRTILGPKVSGVRVTPLVTKIVLLFSVFLLVSNFASNYINLEMNRGELVRLTDRLLIKDLAELYSFAATQSEILGYNGNLPDAIGAIEKSASKNLGMDHSVAFGVMKTGALLFWASKQTAPPSFGDGRALAKLADTEGGEGKIGFSLGGSAYFGVFKYSEKWRAFIVRAEETREFHAQTDSIFARVVGIIFGMTVVIILVGALLVKPHPPLRRSNHPEHHEHAERPEDDAHRPQRGPERRSHLPRAFVQFPLYDDRQPHAIFRRFVTQDIAQRAYNEKEIRLEGTTKDLTILFSDIKGFTYMTETLGMDMIDVLNLHYQRAIGRIHDEHGIVGSIIGDALLAVFGTWRRRKNRWMPSRLAFLIQEVAAEPRRR